MKIYLLGFVFLGIFSTVFRSCDKNNVVSKAYHFSQDSLYDSAAVYYQLALDSFQVKDSAFIYDYALNQFLIQDTSKTLPLFKRLETNSNKELSVKSINQIGLVYVQNAGLSLQSFSLNQLPQDLKKDQLETASSYFQKGLRIEPSNDNLRNNYELAQLILDALQNQDKNKDQNKDNKDQKDQEKKDDKKNQDQKNKDDQKDGNKDSKDQKDQKNKDGKDGDKDSKDQKKQDGSDDKKDSKDGKDSKDKNGKNENEGKDQKDGKDKKGNQQDASEAKKQQEAKEKAAQQKMIDERLKQQNMSREQAEMLLKQSQEQNKKYLQQINKKSQAPSNNKPDW